MSGFVNLGVPGAVASAAMIGAAIAIGVMEKFAAIKWARMLVLPMILSGAAGLASIQVFGYSFAGLTSTFTQKVSSAIGAVAPALATALVILGAIGISVIVLHDIWAVKIGRRGVLSSIGAPVTVGFVPGALGTFLVAILGFFPLVLGAIFARLLGM